MFHYEAPSTVSSNHTLQAYLCIRWIQLLTEQLGVRITDVLDAKEALQATRQADRHFKVCYLLHTAQHQHTLLHILENTTTTKKHTQNKDTVLKTLIILLIHHQIIRSLFCSRSVFLILSLWRLSRAGALVAMYFYDNQQRLVCKCVDSVCVNTFTARKGRQKLRTAGLNTYIVNIYIWWFLTYVLPWYVGFPHTWLPHSASDHFLFLCPSLPSWACRHLWPSPFFSSFLLVRLTAREKQTIVNYGGHFIEPVKVYKNKKNKNKVFSQHL